MLPVGGGPADRGIHAKARSRETRSGSCGFELAIHGKGTIRPTRRLRPQTSFRSAKGKQIRTTDLESREDVRPQRRDRLVPSRPHRGHLHRSAGVSGAHPYVDAQARPRDPRFNPCDRNRLEHMTTDCFEVLALTVSYSTT